MISLFCLELAFGLFRVHAGDMFVVKDKCYLPLFENNKETRLFEKGKKGCNCDDLDTVLLPGSVIKVLGYKENGMAKVECEMTERVKHGGFVYTSSVEDCCKKFDRGGVKRERSPMSLEDIKKVFERCLSKDNPVPYCWGGNNFETIPLRGVPFKSANETAEPYELRGFDCSGLLYYISDGTLPHATGALKNFGTRLFTVQAEKNWDTTDLGKAVKDLRDTDFIAIKGHVIVSYNGGLIEFRSKDLGCCFTPKEGTIQRVTELIEAAKKKNSDVWFVRWHPEYWQGK